MSLLIGVLLIACGPSALSAREVPSVVRPVPAELATRESATTPELRCFPSLFPEQPISPLKAGVPGPCEEIQFVEGQPYQDTLRRFDSAGRVIYSSIGPGNGGYPRTDTESTYDECGHLLLRTSQSRYIEGGIEVTRQVSGEHYEYSDGLLRHRTSYNYLSGNLSDETYTYRFDGDGYDVSGSDGLVGHIALLEGGQLLTSVTTPSPQVDWHYEISTRADGTIASFSREDGYGVGRAETLYDEEGFTIRVDTSYGSRSSTDTWDYGAGHRLERHEASSQGTGCSSDSHSLQIYTYSDAGILESGYADYSGPWCEGYSVNSSQISYSHPTPHIQIGIYFAEDGGVSKRERIELDNHGNHTAEDIAQPPTWTYQSRYRASYSCWPPSFDTR